MSPFPHLELNKDGTSNFIQSGLPMPRWYRPELLLGPARAVPPAATHPSAPEYRAAYAVYIATLPPVAAPALPVPPNAAPVGVLMTPGPTRYIQQLTWTPGVTAMEPALPKRIVMMALPSSYLPGRYAGNVDPASAPVQAHPEQAVPNRVDGIVVKDDI